MTAKLFVWGTFVTSLVLAAGCGDSPTAPAPSASVQLTVSPSIAAPVVCPPSHCGMLAGQLEVEATLTVRETAGVSVVVSRIGLTLRRQSDNAGIATGEIPDARGARISANGTGTFPIAMHFDMPLAERNMKVVIVLEGSDSNNHPMNSTLELEVRM